MKKMPLDKIISAAKMHNNIRDFYKKNTGEYRAAIKRGILKDITSHMVFNYTEWTNDALQKEALKYTSRTEFDDKSASAYNTACKRGILDQICQHMPIAYTKWTDDLLISEARKCSTKSEIKNKNPNAYAAIHKRKIQKVAFSHMPDISNGSSIEKIILEEIKLKYPSAKKYKKYKVFIPYKPHISAFEIDIFVPELNKGIEFDGSYYHTYKMLKKSRTHWPDEDVINYHTIKDEYFKSCNIDILHITERDWLRDRNAQLCLILDFLGSEHV